MECRVGMQDEFTMNRSITVPLEGGSDNSVLNNLKYQNSIRGYYKSILYCIVLYCIQVHLDIIPRKIFYLSSFLFNNINVKTYRTINWPVVLCGCDNSSFTLREERKLRVFENRGLREIFWSKRDEVTREWRKLHNEELNDLYCSRNIVRVIKSRRKFWVCLVARM